MALLITLAAISFLMAVTVQLATSVNWQMQASAGQVETVRLNGAVQSGLSLFRAAMDSDARDQKYDTLQDSWNSLQFENVRELIGSDELAIGVEDQSGKIQVNRLALSAAEKKKILQQQQQQQRQGRQPRQGGQPRPATDPEKVQQDLWRRFLLSGKFAVEDEDEASVLIDALADWIDEDDNERDNGAENGYYQALDTPYTCRNGPLQYPEELLLVKGFSRKIVYGDEEHQGIIDYLTIYGQDGKININTAPLPVLQALAEGMDEEIVTRLDEFRKDADNLEALKNPEWYRQSGDFPGYIVIDRELITAQSSYFFCTISAGLNGMKITGQGILHRDPDSREQALLSWKVD